MKIRIYYEDTDCGTVVYYANYLRYFERSRTEFLRERGVDLSAFHETGFIFAVTETSVSYRKSARYNDLIDVETRLLDLNSYFMTFENIVTSEKGELLAKGTTKLVAIDAASGKACRIPEPFAQHLR